MHACRKPKWVHIEHWIVGIQHLAQGTESLPAVRLGGLVWIRSWWLIRRGVELRSEWGRVRSWPTDFGWILVFDHIGVCIVLLLCTHGVNLGRT